MIKRALLLTLFVTVALVNVAEAEFHEELEARIAEAYLAIRDVERAGGNVEDLVSKLNQVLDTVRVAREEEDASVRVAMLNNASKTLSEILQESIVAKEEGILATQVKKAAGIALGAGMIAMGGLAYFYSPKLFWNVWLMIKKRWVVKVSK